VDVTLNFAGYLSGKNSTSAKNKEVSDAKAENWCRLSCQGRHVMLSLSSITAQHIFLFKMHWHEKCVDFLSFTTFYV